MIISMFFCLKLVFILLNLFIVYNDIKYFKILNKCILIEVLLLILLPITDVFFKIYISIFILIFFIVFINLNNIGGGDIKLILISIFSIDVQNIHLFLFSIVIFSLILFIIYERRSVIPMAPAIVIAKFIFCEF